MGTGVPTADATTWTPACAIIPANLADGGESIEELPCVSGPGKTCAPNPLPCALAGGCQFDGVPGTVGWKSGFRAYRDEALDKRVIVNGVDKGGDEVACSIAEVDLNANGTPNLTTSCKRRFARTRFGLFRYVLWIHAIGIPKSDDPASPLFHLPKNISGMADFLGADAAVALGLWDGGTGSKFMQASTLMHELGHTLGRRHGGETGEPNCKPNYLSVMNYLFQVGGLINAAGVAEIGYAKVPALPVLNEGQLSESTGLGSMPFRTRWYAPASTSFIHNDPKLNISTNTNPATTRRCNGSGTVSSDDAMARIDGTTTSGPIDWNANGTIALAGVTFGQDLNFSASGTYDQLTPKTDWDKITLQQVGIRRNVGGWSVDSGFWDSGFWDSGVSDPGFWDSGFWDSGFWDSGFWDSGFWDSGFWDSGAEQDVPVGELDLDTAESAGAPPNDLKAAVSGKNVLVTWTPPFVSSDKVHHYEVYRLEGTAVTPANLATKVQIGTMIMAPTTQVVDTTAKTSVTYVYIALAESNDARRSSIAVSPPFLKK